MGSTFPRLPPSTREDTYSAVLGCAQLYSAECSCIHRLVIRRRYGRLRCALHIVGPWPSGKLSILEQPADLNRLTGRYVEAARALLGGRSAARQPWLLYMAFNHVHTPDFASRPYCNTTLRGRSGEIARDDTRDDTRDDARAEDGATALWSETLREKTPLAEVESVNSACHAHRRQQVRRRAARARHGGWRHHGGDVTRPLTHRHTYTHTHTSPTRTGPAL